MTTPNVALNSYDNNYQPIQSKPAETGTVGSVFTEVQESCNSTDVVKKYTKEDIKKILIDSLKTVIKENNISSDVLNLNLDDDKNLEKVLRAFTDISNINDLLSKDTGEIDAIIAKIVKDAKVAFKTGWTLNGFSEQQKKYGKGGLGERLGGFSKEIREKGFANVSEAEQKRAIMAFFNTFFQDMEKKESHDVVVRKQLQTFGRILINSSEEEKVAFKEVVKQLLSENIEPGIKEVLESLECDKDRQTFAESFTNEDLKEISQSKDKYGNRISEKDMQSVMDMLTKYKSKESIKSTHEFFDKEISDFIEANKEALDTIQKKIENDEPLTDEEQELLNELNMKRAIAAGEMTGTASNKGLGEDEIDELLRQMNEDNYNHGEDFYCGVMEDIAEYIESHRDSLNLSPKEFKELLDRISNGNYSLIQSGEKGGLNPPGASGGNGSYQAPSAQNPETGLFYTQPQSVIYNSQNSLAELRKSIAQSTATNTTPQLVKNESAQNIIQTGGDKKASLLTKYRQKVGNLSFVNEIFNNKVNLRDMLAVNMALNSFENMGKSLKLLTFERINNTSGAMVATEAMSTSEKSEVHAQNIYIAEKLEQQIEDEKKKNNCV